MTFLRNYWNSGSPMQRPSDKKLSKFFEEIYCKPPTERELKEFRKWHEAFTKKKEMIVLLQKVERKPKRKNDSWKILEKLLGE